MKNPSLTLPLVLIVAGAIWFLKSTDIRPATAVLMAVGLGVAGAVVLLIDGINKQSVIAGPMLMYIGAAIYVRSEYLLGYSPLIALGMMLLGGLMLLSRSDLVPHKRSKIQPPAAK